MAEIRPTYWQEIALDIYPDQVVSDPAQLYYQLVSDLLPVETEVSIDSAWGLPKDDLNAAKKNAIGSLVYSTFANAYNHDAAQGTHEWLDNLVKIYKEIEAREQ